MLRRKIELCMTLLLLVGMIIVSKKLNVSKNYVRDIRNILYIWEKYGYNVAYTRFFKKYKEDKGHIKKGEPNLINVLNLNEGLTNRFSIID